MVSRLGQNFAQAFSAFIVAVLCVGAIGYLQVPELRRLSRQEEKLPLETVRQNLQAEGLYLDLMRRLPALGFENVIADWIYLKFLQYFGDDDRDRTDYTLSPEYFEIILGRDPRFLPAYFFLSTSTSLYAGMPERSINLMDQGLASMTPQVPPQSYYAWRFKGIDELLFLGDSQAAKKSFEMTAAWASTYADIQSQEVAAFSRRTAAFLAKNPNSKSAQIGAWSLILSTALDNRTRLRAIERIRALGGDVVITPEGRVRVRSAAKD